MDTIKRFFNWLRIQWHLRVTGKAKTFILKDEKTGKEVRATVEQHVEDVCAHKEIREITHTLWQCTNKKCDTYFMIPYKIMLDRTELAKFFEQIGIHLKAEINLEPDA